MAIAPDESLAIASIDEHEAPLRILLLTQHFWPEQFRINSFVEALIEAGADVAVLTGQPNYPAGRVFDGYRSAGVRVERHPRGYDIYRVPLIPRGGSSPVRLALNYLSFLTAAGTAGPYLLRGRPFDVVFVYGTSPIFQAFAAFPLRWLKRAPVVLWVQDLWPNVLQATGIVRNPRMLALVERAVSALYRRVDLILGQSEGFVEAIRPLAGRTPVEYLPNSGDPPFPDAAAATSLAKRFNVIFAGNLGRAQALHTIVDAATLLQQERDIGVTLFGSGAMEDWVREQIELRSLGNLVLAGRVPPEAMPAIFRQSSALLLTLADDPMVSRTVPSKLQSYLAAGIPVIAAANGEPARVVREAGAGITCAAEDASGLAQAILALRDSSREEAEAMGRKGRAYYETNFEPGRVAARLLQQIRALLRERERH